MKLGLTVLCFAAFIVSSAAAQNPEKSSTAATSPQVRQSTLPILIQTPVIAMPHDEASQFAGNLDLAANAPEALAALQKLIGEKKATAVTNLSVTTRSGTRALSDSGKRSLNVEAVLSPDDKTVDISLLFKDDTHQISTSLALSNPGVKFLGSMESPADPTMTQFVFLRVSQ